MNSWNIHNIEWKWAFGPWGGAGGVIHIKVIEWWKHLSELTFLSEFQWIEINFAPLRHAAFANICGAGQGGTALFPFPKKRGQKAHLEHTNLQYKLLD